jgi:hypothetical protein
MHAALGHPASAVARARHVCAGRSPASEGVHHEQLTAMAGSWPFRDSKLIERSKECYRLSVID